METGMPLPDWRDDWVGGGFPSPPTPPWEQAGSRFLPEASGSAG